VSAAQTLNVGLLINLLRLRGAGSSSRCEPCTGTLGLSPPTKHPLHTPTCGRQSWPSLREQQLPLRQPLRQQQRRHHPHPPGSTWWSPCGVECRTPCSRHLQGIKPNQAGEIRVEGQWRARVSHSRRAHTKLPGARTPATRPTTTTTTTTTTATTTTKQQQQQQQQQQGPPHR
jgi:hypothetical protein